MTANCPAKSCVQNSADPGDPVVTVAVPADPVVMRVVRDSLDRVRNKWWRA